MKFISTLILSLLVISCETIELTNIEDLGDPKNLNSYSLSGYAISGTDIYTLDYVTGVSSFVGSFGAGILGFNGVGHYSATSNSITIACVAGGKTKSICVYDLNTNTGSVLTAISSISSYSSITLIGFANDNSMYATAWDSGASEQKVFKLNLSSPTLTEVGSMTSFSMSTGGYLFNAARNKFYVIGGTSPGSMAFHEYDISSNTSTSTPRSDSSTSIVGVKGSRLLGVRWNGSAEEFVSITIPTGTIQILGTLPGFSSWSNQGIYDASNELMYVLGNGSSLFRVNTSTNSFIEDVSVSANFIFVR